jgi:hypothetical protein
VNFEPRPPNSFPEFIRTYYERCRASCPKLRAIGGKWTPEDLIPGLSDFDTRFIAADDTTAADWAAMSVSVGKVHSDLARQEPRWARMLEHPPGINLTFTEIQDRLYYYPEYHLWTFYEGDPAGLSAIHNYLEDRPWTTQDELFHLRRFATYYGPYQRGIDPPINLGKYESKYPLHSRFMHYFSPAVQSAVSLVLKRNVRGKFEALRIAKEIFPQPGLIDLILEAVERHYEMPEYYAEPRLTEIERALERYLREIYATLASHLTLMIVDPTDSVAAVRTKVATIQRSALERFFELTKFCRLMRGRFLFYGQDIPGFDSSLLIRLEMNRTIRWFYKEAFQFYGLIRFGEDLPPEIVVRQLCGTLLTAEECQDLTKFAGMANTVIRDGMEREIARQVSDIFEAVQMSVERLRDDLRRSFAEKSQAPVEIAPKTDDVVETI